MYGGGEARILECRRPKQCPVRGKMYGWRGGVCILVWAYKKREIYLSLSNMRACHSPPRILESGKMYAPRVHLRILPAVPPPWS